MNENPLIGRICWPLLRPGYKGIICGLGYRDDDFALLVLLPGGALETWSSSVVKVEGLSDQPG